MFEKMTLEDYNKVLGSSAPAPGGGSALAVVGAIACSLVEMSINVTLTKLDKEADNFAYLENSRNFFGRAKQSLHRLADEDARAFRNIIDCMHLPQDTAELNASRQRELQKAYHKAALVPLDVMRICKECYSVSKTRVYSLLYKYVASDCKIGMDLFRNIVENSMENVYANTSLISDVALKEMLEKQGKDLLNL